MRRFSFALCLFAIPTILTFEIAHAQGAPQNRENVGIPQVNVIDKLMAVEVALSEQLKRNSEDDWAASYSDLFTKFHVEANDVINSQNKNIIALALGIKASDAVVALKARDVEKLNASASQMEKLAERLGVDKSHLTKAYLVRRLAANNQWFEAFMALGFLQHEVIRYLEQFPDKKDEVSLIILGGWIQAGQCVTSVILTNYNEEVSNILREPKLVELMISELNKLPDEMKADPVVADILKFLPTAHEIINIGMYEPVPKENVEKLNKHFGELVAKVVAAGKEAGAGAAQ